MKTPNCPRCDSDKVVKSGPHHTEFECQGKCAKDNALELNKWDWVYFQYDEAEGEFCWPAVGVMYRCAEQDLRAVREGKMKPSFV